MVSSSSRVPKGGGRKEESPFSSPYSNLLASPIAARRSSLEERRRIAASFDKGVSPGQTDRIDEEEEQEDGQDAEQEEGEGEEGGEDEDEDEEGIDEDEPGVLSPLLPIFSAAHLGTTQLYSSIMRHLC